MLYRSRIKFIIPVITVIVNTVITPAYADITSYTRQEPITPIPEKIDVDTNRAVLGELLFSDIRLSKDNNISCASCHQLDSGGDDNLAIGLSAISDQHVINTPSIFNAVYNFRQNWNGSAKTLHQQVEMVMRNQHEFNNQWEMVIQKLEQDAEIDSRFNDAYRDGITRDNIIDAIVEYEKTLITPNSRFDRYLRDEDDAITEAELKGYHLFKDLGCISCHQGVNIGGNLYQKFGVFYNYIAERGKISPQDHGRMNVTNNPMDMYVFKVPSLRNVAVTAPYLHDGSAATLEEAISIMGKTQLGRNLSHNEILSIKSFLLTLTGEFNNRSLDEQS